MFAIVYKEDGYPMVARVTEAGGDSVVFWPTEDKAKDFLLSKGADFIAVYDVVKLDDDGLAQMAKALGIAEEQLDLIPFPN